LYFICTLPAWFVFLGGLPDCQGVHEGGSLSDLNRGHVHGVTRNGGGGFLGQAATGWNGIKHHGNGLAGNPGQLDRVADGAKVEDGRAAWNQDQISRTGGGKSRAFRVRGGVDNADGCATLCCCLHDGGQPGCLGGHNRRAVAGAAVLPAGRAGLGVKVNNDGGLPGSLGGNGKVKGQGGFPCPAFL